jgi:hypothetical protein
MHQFGRTGIHVEVWAMGPNRDGGGRGAQLTSLGVYEKTTYIEPRLNINILYI